MKNFATYVEELASLVELSSDGRRSFRSTEIASALDGEPSAVLRRLISVDDRRRDGVFFTGSELAEKVALAFRGKLSSTSVVTDPACGGGDLLLASTRHLPQRYRLADTLELWGQNLRGTDIHGEFVETAKLRLVLQALANGAKRTKIGRTDISMLFPGIKACDGLADLEQLRASTHIVTNPPFCIVPAPKDCQWTSGGVNLSAVFMDVITQNVESGTHILSILPDVLRSGSRYEKWRELVFGRLSNVRISLLGQFSKHADVDVFVLNGKRKSAIKSRQRINLARGRKWTEAVGTVGDKFFINVGSVVPHRDTEDGPEFPFLAPKNCPQWSEIKKIDIRRRFLGKVFKPPFVVIRRTSRSDDRCRAVATVVSSKGAVAVENHLLVATPRSGGVNGGEKPWRWAGGWWAVEKCSARLFSC